MMDALQLQQQVLGRKIFSVRGHEHLFIDLKLTGPIVNVDYERDMCIDSCPSVSLLKDLCGLKLISDSYFIKYCVYYLPKELKVLLMKKALQNDRFLTVKLLLKFWPFEVFELSSFIDINSWKLFFISKDVSFFSRYLKSWNGCLWTVVNSFVEIIKKEDATQLTCIDISEIPVLDYYVNVISKFATCGQGFAVPLSEKTPGETMQPHLSRSCREQGKYVIKMQCIIDNPHTLINLCSAIQAGQVGKSSLELVITGLRLTNSAFVLEHICHLFTILNPKNLRLFSLGFGSLGYDLFVEILSNLKVFHNLKALDLAYSGINCRNNTLHEKLAVLLRNLVHLSRIDLGNCTLGGKIELLLKQLYCAERYENTEEAVCLPVNKKSKRSCEDVNCNDPYFGKLTYLGLAGCRISENDLIYLANSPHAKTLLNLNLNDNFLGSHIQSFLTLLDATSSSLNVLEIENCHITQSELSQLFIALSKMCKLKFLSISRLQVESQHLLACLPQLSQLPNLQCLSLSYPIDLTFIPTTLQDEFSERTEEMTERRLKLKGSVENVLNYSSKRIEIMWT